MPHGEVGLLLFLVRTVKRCSLAAGRLGQGFARLLLGVGVMARAMLMDGVVAERRESMVLVCA